MSAYDAGCIAYNEYTQTGRNSVPTKMSYSDYLDYWGILYILYIELPKMV